MKNKKKLFLLSFIFAMGFITTVVFANVDVFNQNTQGSNENDVIEKNIVNNIKYEATWAFDVSDVNLLNDNADVVASVKVKKVGDAFFVEGSDYMMPYRTVEVDLIDVYKGTIDTTTFLVPGGVVSIQDYIDAFPDHTSLEKAGYYDFEGDKQNSYVAFDDGANVPLEVGHEYLVHLNAHDDVYSCSSSGFDIFEKDTAQARSKTDSFTNAITNKTIATNDIN